MIKDKSVIAKLTTIICFFFIIFQTIIISQYGSSLQYQPSIYSAYPIYFWLSFVLIFFLMFFNIFLYISKNGNDEFNIKIIYTTLFAGIMSLFIFLSLPYLQNYYFYNPFDSLTHLGYVKYIISTGSFGHNSYPVIHIWISFLSLISGITARQIMLLVPQFFSVLFIISMFLLSRSLNLEKGKSFLIMAFSIIPVFVAESIYVVPSAEAFFMIPLVLLLFVKSRLSDSNISFSILLVLMLIILPFFHQETSIFLFIILITIFFSLKIPLKFNNINNSNKIKLIKSRNTLIPALLLFVGFFMWYSSSVIFGINTQTLYKSIFFNAEQSPSSVIFTSSLNGVMLIYNIIKIFGVDLFYISIASVSAIFIIKRILNKKYSLIDIILLILFSVMFIFTLVSFLRGALIGLRTIKYLILISIFIVSISIYKIWEDYGRSRASIINISKIKSYIVLIGLIGIITLSIFNTYPSPIIKKYNYQVTEDSFNGMSFLINYKVDNSILSTPTTPDRFKDAILGVSGIFNYLDVNEPVDHFSYEKILDNKKNNYGTTNINNINTLILLNGNLGNYYRLDQYLVIDGTTLSDPNLYNLQDFKKLQSDTTVNKVYENGGYSLYYVIGNFNNIKKIKNITA